MTGIERLRELARIWTWDCKPLVEQKKLADIADQIERERACDGDTAENIRLIVGRVIDDMERHCLGHEGMEDSPVARWARELREALGGDGRDPAADVSVSAYDLLPEEDRDAIAWVREHGGPYAVQTKLDTLKDTLDWLRERAGISKDELVDYDELLDALDRRLMPEGMEWLLDAWPKWSDGEYCKFGDWWTADKYGDYKPKQLRRLAFFTPEQLREWEQDEGDDFGYEWDFMRPSDTTYRPDKVEPPAPKVLDADGVEVEVGDDLYSVEGMLKFHVSAIDRKTGRIATEAMFALDRWADPKMYTHRAPVLAADGRPLREGETVYLTDSPAAFVVDDIMTREDGATVVHLKDGAWHLPQYLTHERPDTWERLEEDAEKPTCDYFGHVGGETCETCPGYADSSPQGGRGCRYAHMADLVRRAKKLAGVSE